MAYIANTAFQPLVTNHEFDSTLNITGVFDSDGEGTGAVCSAGFLCTKRAQTPNEGYTGVNNTNTWYMVAALDTVTAVTPIFACNTFNVNQLTDPATGATYKVGTNVLGLAVPEGVRATFTKIVFDGNNIYRFGVGNLSGTLGANGFCTIDDGLLVPAAAAPAAGLPYFTVLGTGTFTQGAYAGFGYVDLLACCS